jgi:hypothetical protein
MNNSMPKSPPTGCDMQWQTEDLGEENLIDYAKSFINLQSKPTEIIWIKFKMGLVDFILRLELVFFITFMIMYKLQTWSRFQSNT